MRLRQGRQHVTQSNTIIYYLVYFLTYLVYCEALCIFNSLLYFEIPPPLSPLSRRMSTEPPAPSPRHRGPGTEPPAPSPRHRAPGTEPPAPSPRHRAVAPGSHSASVWRPALPLAPVQHHPALLSSFLLRESLSELSETSSTS